MAIFWCLIDPPKTCISVGLIKLCHLLTGLFWNTVDSFAGLFDGSYYMLTGENTSEAEKILHMPLTQKSSGIRTKRNVLNYPLQTKGCKFWVSSGWIPRGHPIFENFDSKMVVIRRGFGYFARPYESCKIYKGRPRRNTFSKLVHCQ